MFCIWGRPFEDADIDIRPKLMPMSRLPQNVCTRIVVRVTASPVEMGVDGWTLIDDWVSKMFEVRLV
jgi:hypothetical protein